MRKENQTLKLRILTAEMLKYPMNLTNLPVNLPIFSQAPKTTAYYLPMMTGKTTGPLTKKSEEVKA